ncbi:hypothetical protein H9Y04_41165 [Streptomyces sp. TRM66268-LWL]|uniref:LPXTG cell wall anchor domain-containing protein n=1 Tax=Streptomyces polyasparticus TaxID=2767826 RepID=A0ABR7STY4_9ACTN|nr:DUF6479 family protein [Streptomyces polyasparticus]MBC9718957.1 hypothetical protein [Streptomyces polyasparticus]
MHTHSNLTELAASSTAPLWLIIVGVIVVLVLLGMFVAGQRRAARRKRSQPPASPGRGAGSPDAQAQRGTGWQTPDDDPDQGNPHR